MKSLTVVFVSSEAVPFSKTGGLADVASSLTAELASQGHELYVFLPLYRQTKDKGYPLCDEGLRFHIELGNKSIAYSLYRLRRKKVTFYFVKQDEYFDREYLYGSPQAEYEDNALRFAFFSKAVLKSLQYLQLMPDIIHCNDWQSALIALHLKETPEFKEPFKAVGIVFTIHNLLYQGIFPKEILYNLGLDGRFFHPDSLEFYGSINFMKAGLLYADVLTTVSKSYAREIQTPDYGQKLEGVLKKRSNDLYGIVNGVDYKQWNPAKDIFIKARYDKGSLGRKKVCKEDLLKQTGLSGGPETLVFGCISRLVANKGIDFIIELIPNIIQRNERLILLGYGDQYYHAVLGDLARQHPEHIALKIGFDEKFAHKIEAGCDIFLMPSRYEPCGLNQLYSLKYGTIPVVGAVGGLEDTIVDCNSQTSSGNGFKFTPLTFEAFFDAINRARSLYNNGVGWKRLMLRAMNCDFSWQRPAREYVDVYMKALRGR